jgi:hypothetical protein
MKQFVFLVILSTSFCLPASADDLKVQQLVRMCNGEDPDIQPPVVGKLMCRSWIGGFLSAMIFADADVTREGLQKSNVICPPDGTVDKTSQLTDILIKLSKDRPDMQHETARSILFGVVKSLYSCKQ